MVPHSMEQMTLDGPVTLLSHDAAPTSQERRDRMTINDTARLAQDLALVTLERDLLRQEREREAGLVRALEQALQRVEQLEQRLQEAQQQLHEARQQWQPLHQPSTVLRPVKRGESLRPAIRDLLKQHPEGLGRFQIEQALGVQKNLAETLSHMKRKQLIRSNRGIYFLAELAQTPAV